jgi:hypothetical protein
VPKNVCLTFSSVEADEGASTRITQGILLTHRERGNARKTLGAWIPFWPAKKSTPNSSLTSSHVPHFNPCEASKMINDGCMVTAFLFPLSFHFLLYICCTTSPINDEKHSRSTPKISIRALEELNSCCPAAGTQGQEGWEVWISISSGVKLACSWQLPGVQVWLIPA